MSWCNKSYMDSYVFRPSVLKWKTAECQVHQQGGELQTMENYNTVRDASSSSLLSSATCSVYQGHVAPFSPNFVHHTLVFRTQQVLPSLHLLQSLCLRLCFKDKVLYSNSISLFFRQFLKMCLNVFVFLGWLFVLSCYKGAKAKRSLVVFSVEFCRTQDLGECMYHMTAETSVSVKWNDHPICLGW